MENGGGGEHRPWMYDNETLDIYRSFVKEHERISLYQHTTGSYAFEAGVSSITPVAERNTDSNHNYTIPRSTSYLLGADIYVSPITSDSPAIKVDFPGDPNEK
jgi:alpha-glucosidase (family GH31 glycosyl hydrolase)